SLEISQDFSLVFSSSFEILSSRQCHNERCLNIGSVKHGLAYHRCPHLTFSMPRGMDPKIQCVQVILETPFIGEVPASGPCHQSVSKTNDARKIRVRRARPIDDFDSVRNQRLIQLEGLTREGFKDLRSHAFDAHKESVSIKLECKCSRH